MNNNRSVMTALTLVLAIPALGAQSGTVAGNWMTIFQSPMGPQDWSYDFEVNGQKLTGQTHNDDGDNDIQDGMVKGDSLTFVDIRHVMNMALRMEYKCTVASAMEIKCVVKVGEFGEQNIDLRRGKE